MITIEDFQSVLQQAKNLVPHAPNEEAKKQILLLIYDGEQAVAVCHKLQTTEFTGVEEEIVREAMQIIQDLYNKYVSN